MLDGRAIQDVLIYPNIRDPRLSAPGVRNIGSSLRWYDPEKDEWVVVWLGVTTGTLTVLRGGQAASDIRLRGQEPDGSIYEWVFTDITDNTFHWVGKVSEDGGLSWRMEQEMLAVRRRS